MALFRARLSTRLSHLTMKRLYYLLGLLLLLSGGAFAQKITTLSPYVEQQSQPYVNITKVELTKDFTILYFTLDYSSNPRSLEDMILGRRSSNEEIEIDPNCRLYEPGNAGRKFRFVKAEGIPVAPQKREIRPGDMVKFVVYFERLEPGIEVFDMFEGRDQGTKRYWNYFSVHVRNPKRPLPKKQPVPEPKNQEPPVIAEKPKDILPPVEPKKETVPAPQLVTLRGTVVDAKTQKPISARISYVVPSEGNGLDSMQLSASSGRFRLNLDAGNKYAYVATAKGYFPSSGAFDLTQAKGGQEIDNQIVLNPVAVGEAITLNNIYFDISKFDLLSSSFAEMDRLTQLMRENPTMEIRVEGHTDNLGDFDKNMELSQNRANAVKQYLVSKGIDAGRIEAKGFGPTRPVTKGTSESERRRNRRVELVVVKM
jgi:OOP family OmpA-OmpF porin